MQKFVHFSLFFLMAFVSQPALLPSDFGFSSGSATVKPAISKPSNTTPAPKKVKRKRPSKKQSAKGGTKGKGTAKKSNKKVKSNKRPLPWK